MFFPRILTGLFATAWFCAIFGVAVLSGVTGFSNSVVAQQTTAGKTNQAAPAAKNKVPQFVAGPWAVNCQPSAKSKKLVCMLSQSIVVAKSRQKFVMVSVRPWEDDKAPATHVMVLQLPHGLALASGAAIQVDDKKLDKLAIFTSDAQGVYARIGVTEALLLSLRKGSTMKVNFAARNGRKIIVLISLKGFSASFAKLG